mgnify:CR=1 FL=1
MLNASDGKPSYPRYVAVIWPLVIMLSAAMGWVVSRGLGAVVLATFATLFGWFWGVLLCAVVRLITRRRFVYGVPIDTWSQPQVEPHIGRLNVDEALAAVTALPPGSALPGAEVSPPGHEGASEAEVAARARLLASQESDVIE